MTYPHLAAGRRPARPHRAAGAPTRPGSTSAGRDPDDPGAGRLGDPGPAAATARRLGGRRPRRRTGVRVLLGERDGRTWFAVVVPAGRGEGGAGPVVPAARPAAGPRRRRGAAGAAGLPRARAGRVATGRPGSARAAAARWSRARPGTSWPAPSAARSQFPRTDPAVIMVVTARRARADEERCLLGRQAAGRRAASRRWPASASRGRRSRTPYAARSPRRPASSSAR